MVKITKENSVLIKSRKEWRDWLRKNHAKKESVYMVKYKKHTGKPIISHSDTMDDAICFGWIDTIINRLNNDLYMIKFVKRNKNSKWSYATQKKARRLKKEGLMTKAGWDSYKDGLKRPVHDKDVPKNPNVPKELKEALEKNKVAKINFYNFAPSYKRIYLIWVLTAKREETKVKRIKEVVKRASENRKV
jgi:uncharacterized protein YdeI (YjbR/CyaY-like superfamily)